MEITRTYPNDYGFKCGHFYADNGVFHLQSHKYESNMKFNDRTKRPVFESIIFPLVQHQRENNTFKYFFPKSLGRSTLYSSR